MTCPYAQSLVERLARHRRPLLLALIVATLAYGAVMSLFRDARKDESIYLNESAIMADCLRAGAWFGNEAVGVHGFLSKLPGAFLFMAAGKSVYGATLVNVILAAVCVWLCFRLLRRLLASEAWALIGSAVMALNFQFLRLTPTYNRDIAALLCVLLFLDALWRRRNRWLLGILLMLILDTKEYIFFITVPAFGVWVLVDEFSDPAHKTFLTKVRFLAARLTAAFLPAGVYLVLMFCTSLIPLNMFAAHVLGLSEGGRANPALSRFSPKMATENVWRSGRELVPMRTRPERTPTSRKEAGPLHTLAKACRQGVTIAGRYAGKLFYASLFSFDSIPKAAALPALAMSVLVFVRRRRQTRTGWTAICLFLWVFLLIQVLMVTNPRYMLPVFPLLIAFLVLFVRDGFELPRFSTWVLVAAAVYAFAGLYFNRSGLWKKSILNAAMLGAMALALIARRRGWRHAGALTVIAPLVVGAACALAAFRYMVLDPIGPVWNHRMLGYNKEAKAVIAEFPQGERFWVNDIGWMDLPLFYRGERPRTPEWRGTLKGWVPKKHLLHRYDNLTAYGFWWQDDGIDFRKKLKENRIVHVGLMVPDTREVRFYPYDAYLEWFHIVPWLTFERSVPFKNKTLHLFRYDEPEHEQAREDPGHA